MDTLPSARPAASAQLFRQKTIARPVAISGVGIHSGQVIHLGLHPAPEGTGVVFRRTDSGGLELPATAETVASVELATTLGRNGVTISTVEHLLAAVRVCDVDNLWIDLDGPEVPILDGSALPFLHLLEAAGLRWQSGRRRILAVTAPLTVEMSGKRIRVSPYPGLRVTYSIDFAQASIGHQEIDLVLTRDAFASELAPARTFALLDEIERLHRRGLGLGGDQDNCVVFGPQGPINTILRFADEPVRHKALDAVGDLALAGSPLWAHLEVERGGHQLHYALLEALRRRPDCCAWVEGHPRPLSADAADAADAADDADDAAGAAELAAVPATGLVAPHLEAPGSPELVELSGRGPRRGI
jgi:UDP-3-O-[3-hydroxymyristoyl] N-acetylglucosamine deacetylase